MKNLEKLYLHKNSITNISALSDLKKLVTLNLYWSANRAASAR